MVESPLTYQICTQLWTVHKNDQNFPQEALNRIEDFVKNHEAIVADPVANSHLIREIKIECILSTEFSPYLEVRANTENTDDPTMASMTFRVILIGTIFSGAGSFIDTLFLLRQPSISVGPNVAQMLACELPAMVGLTVDPCGTFLERIMPKTQFNMFGRTMSFNPGPFTRKEHMLITIMYVFSM